MLKVLILASDVHVVDVFDLAARVGGRELLHKSIKTLKPYKFVTDWVISGSISHASQEP